MAPQPFSRPREGRYALSCAGLRDGRCGGLHIAMKGRARPRAARSKTGAVTLAVSSQRARAAGGYRMRWRVDLRCGPSYKLSMSATRLRRTQCRAAAMRRHMAEDEA